MATEELTFPGAPTLTNGNDGQNYGMGIRFSLVAPQSCEGVAWERTPDNPIDTPAGGQWVATLWNWDTQAILASQVFTPVAAIDQHVSFSSPVALLNGVNYAVTVYTRDYVFRSNASNLTITTPSANVVADQGVLANGGTPTTFPVTGTLAWYYVSPLMTVAGPDPAEGTAALGLDHAVSTTGGTDAEGSASAGLGLAVAASGSRPAQGAVTLGLGLAPAANGERASEGTAGVGLALALATTGVSGTPEGEVALTLRLAVSAHGSNGDSGRPVKAWPYGDEPVSSFPWTPRPVKSFQEVSTP